MGDLGFEFDSVADNVLNLLDFLMESLESDGFAEDLDARFRKLGPVSSVLIRNSSHSVPVSILSLFFRLLLFRYCMTALF
jgi:hypothetical protein